MLSYIECVAKSLLVSPTHETFCSLAVYYKARVYREPDIFTEPFVLHIIVGPTRSSYEAGIDVSRLHY